MTQTSFAVATETQLNDAIRSIDAGGANAAVNTHYAIAVTASIALSQDLLALNLDSGSSLTIGGVTGGGSTPQMRTIDGGGAYRGFFAYAGTLTLQHLAIQNALAAGGAGGTGRSAGAGGGGAGLGGGLFVATGASVTLSAVSFSGNAALGGAGGTVVAPGGTSAAGGGGGLGGAGGTAQPQTFRDAGGGGVGSGANGQSGAGNAVAGSGIIPGAAGGGAGDQGGAGGASAGGGGGSAWNGAGGGGGGVGGGAGTGTAGGGFGGFGGGGGGGIVAGEAGFGGGGGGGGVVTGAQGGLAGFGGGNGAAPRGAGGGGLGAGGDIFVQEGGRLTIAGGSVLNQGSVTAGAAGGSGAQAGQAYGDGLFIQGTLQTVTLVALAGETVSIAGAIVDMTSARDPSGSTGVGNLDLDGEGTIALGGSVALAGTIAFDPAAAATLHLAATALNGGTLNATLAGLTFDDQIDLASLAYTSGAQASVDASGRLTVIANRSTTTLPTADLAAGTPFVVAGDGKGGTLVRLQQISVATEADLNAAIRLLDLGVAPGAYVIRLTASITLTQDLLALNLANGTSVTIEGTDGAGHAAVQTIDGGGRFRGVLAYAGAVTLQDLTIRNARAVGGDGGSGGPGYGAGGGGAGLGGGLFVASGANVTLSNVTFSDNAATGGAGGGAVAGGGGGGGGGLGGVGGSGIAGAPYGGGGGVGVTAGGQYGPGNAGPGAGIVPGAPGGGTGDLANGAGGASGGGGGAGALIVAGGGGVDGVSQPAGYGGFGGGGGAGAGIGGNGGLGGGGGGGPPLGIGGNGGFGGGGGGGAQTTGNGGFGGGQAAAANGGAGIAGGGGLGAGGDIFVQEGGVLTLAGGVLLNQGTVTPGAGGAGGQPGRAYGEALFIQGNQSVTLAPPAGQTLTIAGTVTDMTSAQDASRQQGAGTLLLTSAGTVALNGPVALAGGIGFGPTAAAMLQLGSIALAGGTLHAPLSGLNFDDLLDLTDLPYSKGAQAAVNAAGQITVAAGGTTDVLPTTDLAAGTPMLTSPDGKGGTLVRVGRVSVSSQAELNAAIRSIDTSTVIGAYVIDLTASITLTEDLLALNLPTGSSVTIQGTDGAGNAKAQVIDGANTYRGFFAFAGTVTLQDLTIQHARAVGGAGGTANNAGAGGGGAGLGGGLFVASGAAVTLTNVIFSGNAATGGAGGQAFDSSWQGAGGGGGLGGAGGSTLPNVHRDGGGGGVGVAATGQTGPNNAAAGVGIIPGVPGGGVGDDGVVPGTGQPGAPSAGGGGASGTTGQGGGGGGIGGGSLANGVGVGFGGFGGGGGGGIFAGDGGFGGGGGGRIADPGGHGGFGGGGGGGVSTGPFGGLGGFGGGNAAGYGFATNAGGGLGAGGDIFIQEGGRLTIEGGSVLNQAVVNPGGAGAGAQPGRAYGDGVFIQGNQSLVLAPAAGQSLSINGVIADMTGSKDQSGETGAGSVVVDGGGVVALAADNTFTGGVVLQHGTLSLHGAPQGAGSGTITFAPAADSVLVVSAGPTAVANPITGFTTGDRLLFDNIGFVAGQSTAVISKGTLTYTAPSGHASLLLNGIADGTAFAASSAGAGGSFVELSAAQPAPCFLQGTRILTPDGEVAVEDLRFGDLVLTHDDTPARVIWVGQRTVSCAAHPHPERVWPVRISAGAFGRGRPRRDLFLSPDHCLYLDQVLIPVKCLIDGQAIAQVKLDALTYYHVELPRHGVLLAEGLESESYLDSNGRSNFGNGGTVLRLFPDFASVSDDAALLWEALACAPRRVTGPEVAAVRRRLSRRRRAAGGTGRRRKA